MAGSTRKPYPSDLTDEQWSLIEPLIPPQRKGSKGGRPRAVDMREVVNTILYQARSGCQWDMLPHDLLPKSTVYDYFKLWRDNGTFQHINDVMVGGVRQRATLEDATLDAFLPDAWLATHPAAKLIERS